MANNTNVANTSATVGGEIKPLTREQSAAAYEQGGRFARNSLERIEVANAAARTIGAEPTYAQWEAYRVEWLAGHAHQNPSLTGNAHDAAWANFANLLDTLFGLTKPRSTNPAAEKKAAEREKKNAALLAQHQDVPVADLRDQLAKTYQMMAQHPENRDLKKKQQELERVIKVRASEENKTHGERLKTLRTEARAAVGRCVSIEVLEAVLELLDPNADVSFVIED